mgnify:CR=1 FL=1
MLFEERFWKKVDRNGPVPVSRPELGPCWLWTACCLPIGYGRFRVGSRSDRSARNRPAHQIAYELCIGQIPNGLEIDHLCSVRHCVNPRHLEAVTHIENCQRGNVGKKSGAQMRAKTHCPQGHPYAGDNLYIFPHGGRGCRTCGREKARERRARWISDACKIYIRTQNRERMRKHRASKSK